MSSLKQHQRKQICKFYGFSAILASDSTSDGPGRFDLAMLKKRPTASDGLRSPWRIRPGEAKKEAEFMRSFSSKLSRLRYAASWLLSAEQLAIFWRSSTRPATSTSMSTNLKILWIFCCSTLLFTVIKVDRSYLKNMGYFNFKIYF
jgi:hypothetical protein